MLPRWVSWMVESAQVNYRAFVVRAEPAGMVTDVWMGVQVHLSRTLRTVSSSLHALILQAVFGYCIVASGSGL